MKFLFKKIKAEIEKLDKKNYLTSLENIEKRYENKDFKVAVVGEFSSGKSTLINSLIGEDVLLHATIETTATITNIHNTDIQDKKIYVKYSDGKKKEIKGLEEIKSLTTTNSNIDVVSEVDSVDIYTNFIGKNKNLVVIDTPGLNGVADKHKEKTIEEVKNAHVCIFVFQKNGLTESDAEFIKLLMEYNNRFIFVLNFIDELRESEGETLDEKLFSLNEGIKKKVIIDRADVTYGVIGISALKALVSKDRNIKKLYNNDLFELTDTRRKQIYVESCIEKLEEEIKKFINDDEKNKVKEKQAIYSLRVLLKNILDMEREIEKTRRDKAVVDINYIGIEHAKKRKIKLVEEKQNIYTSVRNKIEVETKKLKRFAKDNIDENLKQIYAELEELIAKEKDFDQFEKVYSSGGFNKVLKIKADRYIDDLEVLEVTLVKEISIRAFKRLREYVEKAKINKVDEIKLSKIDSDSSDLKLSDKKKNIEEMTKELINYRSIVKQQTINKSNVEKILNGNRAVLKDALREEQVLNESIKSRRDYLGSEPKPEKKHKYETVYEERGGWFGWIPDLFFGLEEKRVRVECEDRSAIVAWKRKRANLELEIAKEKRILNSKISDLQKQVDEISGKLKKSILEKSDAERRVKRIESQIGFKKDELEQYETKAKKEYLSVKKKNILKEIKKYLLEDEEKYKSVKNILVRKINSDFDEHEKRIKMEFSIEIKKLIEEEERALDKLINGNIKELKDEYEEGLNIEVLNKLTLIYEELGVRGNYESL